MSSNHKVRGEPSKSGSPFVEPYSRLFREITGLAARNSFQNFDPHPLVRCQQEGAREFERLHCVSSLQHDLVETFLEHARNLRNERRVVEKGQGMINDSISPFGA